MSTNLPYPHLRKREPSGIKTEIPADFIQFCESLVLDDGRRFTFKGREFLRQIATDKSNQISVVKGRQTGITSLMIAMMIHRAVTLPKTVQIYSTDTYDHATKFSQDRLDPVLENLGFARHVRDKKISRVRFPNGSLIYVISSYSGFKQARSIRCDFIYLDECQRTELNEFANLKESMSQSKYKKIWICGTGDWEGGQWHKFYSEKTNCMEYQDDTWTPYGTGSNGYHIPQTLLPNINNDDLEEKRHEYTQSAYQMEVLGEFATGGQIPLPYSLVIQSYDEDLHLLSPSQIDRSKGKLYASVDWAGGNAYTVLTITQKQDDILQIVHLEKFDDSNIQALGDKVSSRIDEYSPDVIYCDIGGNQGAMQILEGRHQITKVSLGEHPQNTIMVKEDRDTVVVDKSTYIQRVISWFEEHKIKIPLSPNTEWSIDHLTAEQSRIITKSTGGTVLRFELMKNRNDDFLMSLVFLAVSLDPDAIGNQEHYSVCVPGDL